MVREVTDQEILDAKAQVGAGGLGCEPASAASVAGAKLLVAEGIIGPDERVVCILTGHQLKDPTATVAYHTTDQEKFNEVLAAAASDGPPSPTGPSRCPTISTRSSKRSSCTADLPSCQKCKTASGFYGTTALESRYGSLSTSHRYSRGRRTHGTAAGCAAWPPIPNCRLSPPSTRRNIRAWAKTPGSWPASAASACRSRPRLRRPSTW